MTENNISSRIPDLLPRIRAVVASRAHGLEVDDVTQECCVKILEKEGLYDSGRGPLISWVDAVVRKFSMSVARREARRRELGDKILPPEPLESPFNEEQVSWLLAQLSAMPTPLKEVLKLRYYEDRNLEEIGTQLGISQPAVSKRLGKALAELTRRARIQGFLMSFLPFSWSFKIAGASKGKVVAATGLMAVGLTTACGFFLPSGDVHLMANTSELKATTMADTLEAPLDPNKNTIWVATTQLAWNELRKQVGEDILIDGAPPAARRLNAGRDPSHDLDPASYVVGGGRRADLERVQAALEKSFGRGRDPILKENVEELPPDGVFSYAFLAKDLKFKAPFDILENHPIYFQTTRVCTFGMERFAPGQTYHELMGKQLRVHDVVTGDHGQGKEFIVSLHPEQADDIILALVPSRENLKSIVQHVLGRIKVDGGEELGAGLSFKVPKMDFHLTHEFVEASGRLLNSSYGSGSLKNFQTVAFRFDEKGATLRARSWGITAALPRADLVFDRPFLLMLKEKSAEQPYFVMWVANPEVLIPID